MLTVVHSESSRVPLQAFEDAALRRVATLDDPGQEATTAALSVLARIHRLHPLRCDCLDPAEEGPQACAVRLPSGDLGLRWYNGIVHADGCPFFRDIPAREPTERAERRPPPGGRAYRAWDGSWSVLGQPISRIKLAPGEAPEDRPEPKSPSYTALPRLGRLLLSALHRTGYDQVGVSELVDQGPPAPRHPEHWRKRIFRLLDEPAGDGLLFKDTSTLQLAQLSNWLTRYLPRIASRFTSARPHGFLIDRVDSFEQRGPREAVLRGFGGDPAAEITIACTIRQFGPATPGPYWLILMASRASETTGFDVVDAYVHPAYRADLPIPVDSDLERGMLDVLLDQLRFWRRYPKTSASVSLTKPLFDLEGGQGVCRPDALLAMAGPAGQSIQLAVECMGLEDEAYLAAKATTHPRMLALPHVVGLVEYHPDLPEAEFRRSLTRTLFAATRAP